MKKSTIIKRLNKLADAKEIMRNSNAFKMLASINNATLRPTYWNGRGRYISLSDCSKDICKALDAMRVQYVAGNDAPRGGLAGNFIKIKNLVID